MLKNILGKMKKFIEASLCLMLLAPLSAQEQVVEVTSDPPGALVVVDHLVKGKTPVTLTELEPGRHHFRVSYGPEYHPYREEIEIQANHSESCHVVLAPSTQTSLKQGLVFMERGDSVAAEEAFLRAVTESPRQPEALWWLGRLAYERHEDSQAMEHFREYAQFYPKEPKVHLMLGELHKRAGRLSPAYTSYKLALLNSVEMSHALNEVPSATWKAIEQFGEPVAPIEQLRLAYLYEMKGRIPEALEWVERAVNELYSDRSVQPIR